MIRHSDILLLRVLQLVFVIACIYYWVVIPIVGEVYFVLGGSSAEESMKMSLAILHPIDVLVSDLEQRPSGLWASLLNYVRPLSSFLAFAIAGFADLFIRHNTKESNVRFVYVLEICSISGVMWLLGGYAGYGVFAFLAALCGIGVMRILRSNTAVEPAATAN